MTVFVRDVIEGSVSNGETGPTHDRVFLVEVNSNLPPERKQWEALTDGQIPQKDDRHPFIDGISVQNATALPVRGDPNVMRVEVNYARPAFGEEGETEDADAQWSFTSELVTETTVTDVDGQKMITEFAQISGGGLSLTTLVHEVQVDRPLFTARAKRRESGIGRDKSLEFSGTINRSSWSGFPPKTWLCRISQTPNNKGTYDFEYTFHYRPETWIADLFSRVDGQIPLGAILGNGRTQADVYVQKDFNRLKLKIPR